jgi:hypothetical protein
MAGTVIRIFLVDGKPDGLRTIELSNSTVLGTVFPRPSLDAFLKRSSAQRPGAYILIGKDPSQNDMEIVYIGEGDPVGPRLKAHGVQKDFWTEAAVFTSKDDYLTKTQIQYLEVALVEAATSAARAKLDNVNTPTAPNISEADQAEVAGFFQTMKILLGVSGFDLLRSWEEPASVSREKDIFHLRIKSAYARMVRSASSYIVLGGSTALAKERPSAERWCKGIRDRLISAGILQSTVDPNLLKFSKDTAFDSPSTAASVVNGGNASGPSVWKLDNGQSLKEVEKLLNA